MPNLLLIPGTLPSTCYPASAQEFYNTMFELGVAVQSSTLVGVLMQDAQPSADQTGFVWIRTNGGAPVTPPVWTFFGGQWVAKHPTPINDRRLVFFDGIQADVDILDGGVAGAVSDNSGPFWQIDATMAARFPIGAGTLPSGTILLNGNTGGEEKHLLLQTELPATLTNLTAVLPGFRTNLSGASEAPQWLSPRGSATPSQSTTPATETGTFTFSNTGGGLSHPTMPPYRTGVWIRRTARIYCTSPIA